MKGKKFLKLGSRMKRIVNNLESVGSHRRVGLVNSRLRSSHYSPTREGVS